MEIDIINADSNKSKVRRLIYVESKEYFPKEIRKKYKMGEYGEIEHENVIYEYVNAHINNISFPKSIDELETYIYEHGCYNVEDVLNEANDGGYTVWTVPRSSVIGDIVLYFHAKTAIQWIRKLETAAKNLDNELHNKQLIFKWLKRARELYSCYGGKVFAIGRINSRPEKEDEYSNPYHWSGRIFAEVSDLHILDTPIDISEFNSFILVSRQSAITPLPSKEFEKLKSIILDKNCDMPQWFKQSKIGDCNLSNVNQTNFLEITDSYRKRFLLESNFRSYYVNYFLKTLAGRKYYSECQCHSKSTPLARVDNMFEFGGKRVLLEVKLNIELEDSLISQLEQYIKADYIYMDKDKKRCVNDFEKDFMLVIDVYSLYKYDAVERRIVKLYNLDEFKNTNDIIEKIRRVI